MPKPKMQTRKPQAGTTKKQVKRRPYPFVAKREQTRSPVDWRPVQIEGATEFTAGPHVTIAGKGVREMTDAEFQRYTAALKKQRKR